MAFVERVIKGKGDSSKKQHRRVAIYKIYITIRCGLPYVNRKTAHALSIQTAWHIGHAGAGITASEVIDARRRDRLMHVERSNDGGDEHKGPTELHNEIELLLIAAERQPANDLFCEAS